MRPQIGENVKWPVEKQVYGQVWGQVSGQVRDLVGEKLCDRR